MVWMCVEMKNKVEKDIAKLTASKEMQHRTHERG